jgi:hypothetical protein
LVCQPADRTGFIGTEEQTQLCDAARRTARGRAEHGRAIYALVPARERNQNLVAGQMLMCDTVSDRHAVRRLHSPRGKTAKEVEAGKKGRMQGRRRIVVVKDAGEEQAPAPGDCAIRR